MQGAQGDAVKANVELGDRVLTSHGLQSGRTKTGSRQVRDATYFQTELRNKIQQINREADALTNSSAELKKRESVAFRLRDSVNELRSRVTALQGELHDVAYSQSRSKEGASLDDLRTEAQAAETEATKLRNEANIAYKAREEASQRLEKNDQAAQKMRADTELRIVNDLGEEAAKQFRIISQENGVCGQKEAELRKQLQEQSQITSTAYANAFVLQNQQNQQNITKAIDLHRDIRACKREIEQLRSELSKDQSEDPEFSIKQQLKNQIKTESVECKRLMEEIKQLEAAIATRRRILAEITPDVMTAITKEQKDMLKNVMRAERSLQEWPRQKTELSSSVNQLQNQMLTLLTRLPSPVARTDSDAADVATSLSQKTRELERLNEQEAKVVSELGAVQISVEQLNETFSALQKAVQDAESVEDVVGTEILLKQQLAEQVENHKTLQEQLKTAEEEHRKLDEQIQSNESVQTLRGLFAGLAQNLQKQYQAEQYIRQRELESNYDVEKRQAMALMNEVQKELGLIGK